MSQQKKYRKDYKAPAYLIDTVNLTIELGEEVTYVTSKMHFTVAPAKAGPHIPEQCDNSEGNMDPRFRGDDKLVLNGSHQKLLWVKLNDDEILADRYQVTDDRLTIPSVPESFDLEIKISIEPQNNTSLMGLYRSGDLFCTQCEPEGFRKITYFLDRPDVLARYRTTIIADKQKYPVLLSNGNLVDNGDLLDGLHFMTWEDPFPKPSYLFAMVAGDLDCLEDYFITCSGRKVTLRIFSEQGKREKCRYAMTSLKKAMKWDEEAYGREYDLDIFMIVAVSDFNAGAMENKGLNIFNDKYIFAKPDIATDKDYENIDRVVGHEYFHNWSGDRVTCRDWFQLCLKEGFTVFREQSFSESLTSAGVKRIDDVQLLRTQQFPEDAGPMAHPIRPDNYIEMNNFYTMTVYEKGAEVVRMLRTILGPEKFRFGTDYYFQRFDGQAVTCDDFVYALAKASGEDLSQFLLWYQQAGTPEIKVESGFDADQKAYQLTISQHIPSTPEQPKKLPMQIPFAVALFDQTGNLLKEEVLNITETQQTFTFQNIIEAPIPSFLRGFSAPVKCFYDYSDEQLKLLATHEQDPFARWEALQALAVKTCGCDLRCHPHEACHPHESSCHPREGGDPASRAQAKSSKVDCTPDLLLPIFKNLLQSEKPDEALTSLLLTLPSELYLAEFMQTVDVDAIHQSRTTIFKILANALKEDFLEIYLSCQEKHYLFDQQSAAKRRLKNTCLNYLMYTDDSTMHQLCMKQFETADNMTDKLAAFTYLANTQCAERLLAISSFYEIWQHEPLVMDKWFAVQAMSRLPDTLKRVARLLTHPSFNLHNPNRVFALLRTFSSLNPVRFHDISGDGYQLLMDQIIQLNAFNPHIAARLMQPFTQWKRFDLTRQHLMFEQLQRLQQLKDLSKNLYEILTKTIE